MKPDLRVLFLAAEAEPFVKVGGLGDVAGSLPHAIRALPPMQASDWDAADVRLMLPLHAAIPQDALNLQQVASFTVFHAGGPLPAEAWVTETNGLPVYLIGGPAIPSGGEVYSPDAAVDGHKFTFFSLAALELARALNWVPHILHANDWHTAPAVYALGLDREPGSFYSNTVTVLGVHNLPYLGVGAGTAMAAYGLPPASQSDLPWWAQSLPLPLGLLAADEIIAPSPTYAQEILTPEFGSGLHDFLYAHREKVTGILNGINVQAWDPAADPHLVANYTAETLEERRANKAALLKELGLQAEPDQPLLAMVTRMDPQKGVDLVPPALELVVDQPWQAVILGTGVPSLEAAAVRLEQRYPERVRAAIRFDARLSRRIYSGADMLLIPSRYEPSGLTQMIAMRYGCIPVARATGGLRDTIADAASSKTSTGFLFEEAAAEDLAGALRRALAAYADREQWLAMQRRGMALDFSWERSAREYVRQYQRLISEASSRAPQK
jgi:starch synthase